MLIGAVSDYKPLSDTEDLVVEMIHTLRGVVAVNASIVTNLGLRDIVTPALCTICVDATRIRVGSVESTEEFRGLYADLK